MQFVRVLYRMFSVNVTIVLHPASSDWSGEGEDAVSLVTLSYRLHIKMNNAEVQAYR